MQEAGLLAVFLASVLGSPHCAGMCGGFVAFYSAQSERKILPHLAYNLGRLVTYAGLGVLAGFVGRSINDLGLLIGIQRFATVVIGVVMIVWGIQMLLGVRVPGADLQGRFWKKLFEPAARLLKNGTGLPPSLLAAGLGLLSTFLPCGFLYAFVAMAAATASPLEGVLVMTLFWAGTVPVMVALGGAVTLLSLRALKFVPKITAVLVLAAGLLSLSGHLQVSPEKAGVMSCPHHKAAPHE